jgi:hypothetical protein
MEACKPQISEKLLFVNWENLLNGFNFDDDGFRKD